MSRIHAQAVAANVAGYQHDEVAGYLAHAYHRRRLGLAISLLARHFAGYRGVPLVADLGANDGQVCTWLADRGMRPIACDIVPHARQVAHARGLLTVGLDAGGPLPLRSACLDGILAGEIIEHLYDPARLLRECARVLRPGGILVVTTPNLAGAQDRLRFLLGRSPRQVDPFHEYLSVHIRPFTYGMLATGLRLAGLTPSRPLSNYVVWRTRFGEVSSGWAARLWPTLGGSLIVAAVR
ncbi:hypothetical protein ALI144C_15095 [Actinosynnema sp. ALI-1.44]|uniref:class I SAM-dependent methyltransferase n=1 Tax=Actinosynnema sp. ALI-1.44 TaxID=1933779 RepID=UPI00097C8C22|nr:class I SAM-dependent methyltransferase [Actinosynnema sp. ALI-1.44]ONI84472.1 hypothetical protein ALI144C_15095 [Actinosynnema sp. ALI-1.44]